MATDEKSFHENLDLLIRLFRKLKEKTSIDELSGIDKTFYQNFEYLLNNYENMKDQISKELLDKFGEPVKDMIAGLVNQLKNELGEEFDKEKPEVQPEKKTETVRSIEEIDKLLKSQILPESEVNKLLDERSQLVKLKIKDILNSDQ